MTDAELRSELLAIRAVPVLQRYARKALGVNSIARSAGLNRLTVYRLMNGDETVSRKSRDRMKRAFAALSQEH